MFTVRLKLLKEEMVNSPLCTGMKKEMVRQALTDASSRFLGSSLLNNVSTRARVKGSHLGHLEDSGARLEAPLRAAFTCQWVSSTDQG